MGGNQRDMIGEVIISQWFSNLAAHENHLGSSYKNPDVQTKVQTNPIKLPEGIGGCLSPPGAFDVQPARRTAGVSRDELL